LGVDHHPERQKTKEKIGPYRIGQVERAQRDGRIR